MHHTFTLPRVSPHAAAETFSDRDFLLAFGAEVGVEVSDLVIRPHDDGIDVSMLWAFSTRKAGIPSLAQRLLPERVELRWEQSWALGGSDPVDGTVGVEVHGRPSGTCRGRSALTGASQGLGYTVDTTTKTSVPWPLSGQVESMIDKDLVGWILRTQVEVAEPLLQS